MGAVWSSLAKNNKELIDEDETDTEDDLKGHNTSFEIKISIKVKVLLNDKCGQRRNVRPMKIIYLRY
jgi:hypothetical protein